jgi:hypothetical protein
MPHASPSSLDAYDAWRAAQAEAVRLVKANRDAEARALLAKVGGLLPEDAERDVREIRFRLFLKEVA